MSDTVLIILIVSCAILAAALVFALLRAASLKKEKAQREDELRLLSEEKDSLGAKLTAISEQRAALESTLNAREEAHKALEKQREMAFEAQREQMEKSSREQKEQMEKSAREQQERFEKLLHDQKEQMKESFKSLSSENSAAFNDLSAKRIAELLKPIQEKFEVFDKSVTSSRESSLEQSASLKTLIEHVMQQSKTVGDEARNLANALTGYSKVQGNFGEMLLTDLLKSAGLEEGVHFISQGVMTDEHGHEIKSESGATMIPDVMVLYPDDTTVIIDSKVSLSAYNKYMNATDVAERTAYAKEHVSSVRNHVDELKKKDYASYLPDGKTKVGYNIMFIPMEGAFRLMLEEDPMLWQAAKNAGVLIVSQMTLVIVLNMIQMSWRQHNQEKNIAEVYKTAEELMSQLKSWMDAYVDVGKSLDKALRSYNESKAKLIDSNQSVVKKIGKLEKLGLAPKRSQGKLKTGARIIAGRESVIPAELAESSPAALDLNDEDNEN